MQYWNNWTNFPGPLIFLLSTRWSIWENWTMDWESHTGNILKSVGYWLFKILHTKRFMPTKNQKGNIVVRGEIKNLDSKYLNQSQNKGRNYSISNKTWQVNGRRSFIEKSLRNWMENKRWFFSYLLERIIWQFLEFNPECRIFQTKCNFTTLSLFLYLF